MSRLTRRGLTSLSVVVCLLALNGLVFGKKPSSWSFRPFGFEINCLVGPSVEILNFYGPPGFVSLQGSENTENRSPRDGLGVSLMVSL